jgi:tRNA(fMet)-specific endonuclease VapC
MLLDTNAVSCFIDGDAHAVAIISALDSVAIPAIVVGEYRFGILQSRYKSRIESLFEEFLGSCSVLTVDIGTTYHYAAIRLELKRAGTPIPANDVWIAALSRQYSMPLMSRDTHVDQVTGLQRRPW